MAQPLVDTGTSRAPLLRRLGSAVFDRPLQLGEVMVGAIALLVAGTLYCVLYCAIAYPPMHGHIMPIGYSISWAAFTFLPWLLALEVAKRCFAMRWTGIRLIAALAGAATAAASIAIGIERLADLPFGVETRSLSFQAADQLSAFVVTAVIAAWARLRIAGFHAMPTAGELSRDRDAEDLPPAGEIAWIAAAGNYVEIRSGAKLLMRRITMTEAEHHLDRNRFVRIHRSTIVNRDHIVSVEPGRAVHMADGTSLRIGHVYRRSLDAK